jgi:hypothetical protein
MSPTTCSKQLLSGSVAAVRRSAHGGSTDDKWRSSDDNDSMRVSWTPTQPASYGSGNHMAAAVKELHQPTNHDGCVAPSMGVARPEEHPRHLCYQEDEQQHRPPHARSRSCNEHGTGARAQHRPIAPCKAAPAPIPMRSQLRQATCRHTSGYGWAKRRRATTTSLSLLEGMAAKPCAAHLHEGSKHEDYGDRDSRSRSVMT